MHTAPRFGLGIAPFLVVMLTTYARAETPLPPAQQALYQKARAVLESACFTCHSHAGKSRGGLLLDSRAALLQGGDNGPVLDEKAPAKSTLLRAISHTDDKLRMPPKVKLAPEQIEALTAWIMASAPWPDSGIKLTVRPRGGITPEDRKWWAIQPVSRPVPPTVKEATWNATAIDRFLRARLDAEGLSPAPHATPAALIRRLTFDLTGLPPTPEEVATFEQAVSRNIDPRSAAEPRESAIEGLVDRLLASPQYGERMARIWLDLVRYAESDGYKADDYRPNAWRYRDWVIRSFNADRPYDRFVREQLAGDEIAPDDPDARLATAFLRLGIYEYNNRDVRGQWNTILDEPTEVVGDVFLGLGMGCARCHDHKFDPILQADYYRLRAFFEPLMHRDDVPLATAEQRAAYQEKLAAWEKATASIREQIEAIEKPLAKKAEREAIDKFPEDIAPLMKKPEAERSPLERQLYLLAYRQIDYELDHIERRANAEQKEKLIALRKELTKFDNLKPAPLPLASTVTDIGPESPPTLLKRKDTRTPIQPGFLTILDEKPATIEKPANLESTGRRTTLASWLTRPDNPLTARVIVNRIWQMHFGRGLVETSSDFGRLGGSPSHPELLDWLARDFVEHGWSLKRLHRQIVLSQAYRQSATHPDAAAGVKKDPENRLLWRAGTRRLEAEQIRDALLAATGKLDRTPAGASVDSSVSRRTIYTKVYRNQRDAILDVFDGPDGLGSVPKRNTTTTPTQSLLLINGVPLIEHARTLATRLEQEAPDDPGRITRAYQLLYGRQPREAELSRLQRFLAEQATKVGPRVPDAPVVQQSKMPYREGKALLVQPKGSPWLRVEQPQDLPEGDFTIEGFVLLRSTYEDGTVRPIAVHHSGDPKQPGWAFGVTGQKSSFKPKMLVLQLWGKSEEKGAGDYEALFSDLKIDLDKPYYVAVSVKLGDTGKESVTFYAKDLSNDEEPLGVFQCGHRITRFGGKGLMSLGGATDGKKDRIWDGLLDDIRLSRGVLKPDELLLHGTTSQRTQNFWRFEEPGLLRDSAAGWHLTLPTPPAPKIDPRHAALVDLCHVLLNTSEFLYVD
jgi:hypothetical protein